MRAFPTFRDSQLPIDPRLSKSMPPGSLPRRAAYGPTEAGSYSARARALNTLKPGRNPVVLQLLRAHGGRRRIRPSTTARHRPGTAAARQDICIALAVLAKGDVPRARYRLPAGPSRTIEPHAADMDVAGWTNIAVWRSPFHDAQVRLSVAEFRHSFASARPAIFTPAPPAPPSPARHQ